MLVIVLLVSFFLLLFIGVPISFALSISSFTAVMTTGAIPVINLVQKTFRAIDSFTLLAIPFFVFAGNVMARGGVSKRLTDMAATLVGRMPGGLAHVATLSSTFFGAISGSAPATTSAIGAVMVPEMEKRNYDKAFTAAVVAASGTIGLIIPPSNTMVMYGTLANASVGKMFIGGVGPGLLMTAVIIIINYVISKKRGYVGTERVTAKEVATAFKNGIWALLMPVFWAVSIPVCSPPPRLLPSLCSTALSSAPSCIATWAGRTLSMCCLLPPPPPLPFCSLWQTPTSSAICSPVSRFRRSSLS